MHTIIILSDTLTHESHKIQSLKELFPDCGIQIFKKTTAEPGRKDTSPYLNESRNRTPYKSH